MAKKKKKPGFKRPIAVTVTAVVITVLFFVRIYQAIKPLVEEKDVIESILFLLLAIGTIMVLIGFLHMRRWSWVFLMVWIGISMVVSLVDYFNFGKPNYIIMASDVIIVFALSQADVQRIFGIRSDTGENII
jgi:hypothetical protein